MRCRDTPCARIEAVIRLTRIGIVALLQRIHDTIAACWVRRAAEREGVLLIAAETRRAGSARGAEPAVVCRIDGHGVGRVRPPKREVPRGAAATAEDLTHRSL